MPMRIALALLLVAACSKSDAPPAGTSTSSSGPAQTAPAASTAKDPAKAREMIKNGAIVIDVRTAEEFASDHLPQATNIPVDQFASRIAEVDKLTGGDKSKPVVLHCAAGRRAAKAKAELDQAGYTNVVNGGGLDDLKP